LELKTTLLVLDNPEYQCWACKNKYISRADYAEITEKSRRLKGCFDSAVIRHTIGDYRYKTCPGNLFSESALFWIDSYERYCSGILPFGGAWVDQPAKLVDIFRCISAHKHDKMVREQQAQALRERSAVGRQNHNRVRRHR
jgi:hypothetical protein